LSDESKYLKTEVPGLVKDPGNGALLYVDAAARAAYKRQARRNAAMDLAVNRLSVLEADVSEIKGMLRELLKR